ncbi:MAG: hypothetical protein QM760_17195 [Nibricoccus sp.]
MIRLARFAQHLAVVVCCLLWKGAALRAQSPASASTSPSPNYLTQEISRARSAWDKESGQLAEILRNLKTKAGEVNRLTKEIEKLRKEIADLEVEKAQALEDMLNGEFCSGCGQTRRALLARGEPFPHPDQHARPATPEELKRTENEYNERLARLRKKLQELENQSKQVSGEISDLYHRFRVLLPVYHGDILKERDLRLADWTQEKETIERGLETLHAGVEAAAGALKKMPAGADTSVAETQLRIQEKQLAASVQKGAGAESRARQQAQQFSAAATKDMDSLAKIAAEIPEVFGLPGGWFLGQNLTNPPRPVAYTVYAVRRFDPPSSPGSIDNLLGDSKRTNSPQTPAPQKSMKDLLEGK